MSVQEGHLDEVDAGFSILDAG